MFKQITVILIAKTIRTSAQAYTKLSDVQTNLCLTEEKLYDLLKAWWLTELIFYSFFFTQYLKINK